MNRRILLDLSSYPMVKQSKIILACMALHNFIRANAMADADFEKCDCDENYIPNPEPTLNKEVHHLNKVVRIPI